MKEIISYIAVLGIFGCTNRSNCVAIFSDQVDTSLYYQSIPYVLNNKCVQDIKLKTNIQEYGKNVFNDTIVIFKDSNKVFLLDKNQNPIGKNVLIDFNNNEKFYESSIQDTIYRVCFDANINGISNGGIFFYLVIGKSHGITGFYINDKSDYILRKYSKPIIRSIKGNIYENNLDTSKIIIYRGKPKGVWL